MKNKIFDFLNNQNLIQIPENQKFECWMNPMDISLLERPYQNNVQELHTLIKESSTPELLNELNKAAHFINVPYFSFVCYPLIKEMLSRLSLNEWIESHPFLMQAVLDYPALFVEKKLGESAFFWEKITHPNIQYIFTDLFRFGKDPVFNQKKMKELHLNDEIKYRQYEKSTFFKAFGNQILSEAEMQAKIQLEQQIHQQLAIQYAHLYEQKAHLNETKFPSENEMRIYFKVERKDELMHWFEKGFRFQKKQIKEDWSNLIFELYSQFIREYPTNPEVLFYFDMLIKMGVSPSQLTESEKTWFSSDIIDLPGPVLKREYEIRPENRIKEREGQIWAQAAFDWETTEQDSRNAYQWALDNGVDKDDLKMVFAVLWVLNRGFRLKDFSDERWNQVLNFLNIAEKYTIPLSKQECLQLSEKSLVVWTDCPPKIIEKMLNLGLDPNQCQKVQSGTLEKISTLVECLQTTQKSDLERVRIITDLTFKKDPKMGQRLLENVDVAYKASAMHHAARKLDLKTLKYLYSLGANPLAKDKNQKTPFEWMMKKYSEKHKKKFEEVFEWFKEIGADGFKQNATENGDTLFNIAKRGGVTRIQKMIKEAYQISPIQGHDLLHSKDKNGASILHWLAKCEDEESITYLLKKGLDINVKDKNGNTPLHWFAKKFAKDGFGNHLMMDFFQKIGADFNLLNNNEESILNLVCFTGNIQGVKTVLSLTDYHLLNHPSKNSNDTPLKLIEKRIEQSKMINSNSLDNAYEELKQMINDQILRHQLQSIPIINQVKKPHKKI